MTDRPLLGRMWNGLPNRNDENWKKKNPKRLTHRLSENGYRNLTGVLGTPGQVSQVFRAVSASTGFWQNRTGQSPILAYNMTWVCAESVTYLAYLHWHFGTWIISVHVPKKNNFRPLIIFCDLGLNIFPCVWNLPLNAKFRDSKLATRIGKSSPILVIVWNVVSFCK
jgi:hypothetical protein